MSLPIYISIPPANTPAPSSIISQGAQSHLFGVAEEPRGGKNGVEIQSGDGEGVEGAEH